VAENVRSTPCQYILPKSCRQIAQSSVTTDSKDELLQPEVMEQIKRFEEIIGAKIENKQSDDNVIEEFSDTPQIPADIFKGDDPDDVEAVERTMPEVDDWTPEVFDHFITAEVLLARGDNNEKAVITRRARDGNDNPIGRYHSNPILDTREYELTFEEDGSIDTLIANAIAEAMYPKSTVMDINISLLTVSLIKRKTGRLYTLTLDC
jgi:hypothetical protein